MDKENVAKEILAQLESWSEDETAYTVRYEGWKLHAPYQLCWELTSPEGIEIILSRVPDIVNFDIVPYDYKSVSEIAAEIICNPLKYLFHFGIKKE